jgi:hypothetical protein
MNSPLRYLPRLLSGRRVGGNRAVYEVFWGTGEVALFSRVFDGYTSAAPYSATASTNAITSLSTGLFLKYSTWAGTFSRRPGVKFTPS